MNRYYVIINGINSLTIPGLAIKELPPITKTLMRNQREEIDGRDGDITTELGYSAYDKTMTIGLYGNYDINQIIAFFNQKGTIVFSDEADKYYNFTILERIDYAKLVKFRTASVKFHCQPFKYELNESPQTITTELVESTGEEATLNDTAETSLQIGLKGNTYQETTTGKNKCISVTKPSNQNLRFTFEKNIAQTITISFNTNEDLSNNSLYLEVDGTSLGNTGGITGSANTRASKTITFDNTTYQAIQNATNVSLLLYKSGANFTIPDNGMIEDGSSMTDFEPYTGGIPAPNPDFPMPVEVVTGDNTIIVGNKNLLKLGTGSSSRNNTELTITEDVLNFKNTGTTNYVAYGIDGVLRNTNYGDRITWNNKILKAGTYTLSYKYLSGSNTATQSGGNFARVYIYGRSIGDTGYVSTELANCNISATSTSSTFTISEDKEVNIVVYLYGTNITIDINFQVMLESGNTATSYTPYQSQEYEINLGTLELCKIGTYQDHLYKSEGNWYKHKEIGKVILDGTIGGYNSGNNWFYIGLSILGITSANALVCNYFKFYENFTSLVNTTIGIGLSNNLTNFLIRNTALASESDYKTWLGNNNTIVYYVLATPTEEQITDEALITQLELLQNAMSYLDQTNVTQTYDNMPFILDLKAIKKGTNEITINNTGNIYSKPIMALNGSGMIEININDTEVLRVDMSEHHNIVIDSANMEAYNPNTMALRNRQVTGNYENLKLNQGENKIKVLGQLTEATITDYTRWL